MLTVYLLRHGETAWNADGNRYCGRTDLPLTERGIEQAIQVQEKLRGVSYGAVYASPLERAVKTAELATERDDVIIEPRLIEVDFGDWEGKPKEEFIPENPAVWEAWMADPSQSRAGGSGESGAEVIERVDGFFQELVRERSGETVLVFAHNGVNRLYLSYKMGMPLGNYRRFSLGNASLTIFTIDESGEFTLHGMNK